MSAAAPALSEARAARAARRRRRGSRCGSRPREGARAALALDSRARLPQLPDDARHRDRRGVGHRDGVDHSGLERHDRRAVRGARQQRRHRVVVHVARGVSRGPHRAAHGSRLQPDSLPRRRPRVDHADHARRRGKSARARRPRRRRSSARRTSYQEVGQYFATRGRFISDSDNETRRRVAVIGEQVRADLVAAGGPARRVHPVQRRVAQDHRPARGEGRDLRPEPGQSARSSRSTRSRACRATSASATCGFGSRSAISSELDNISATITRLLRIGAQLGPRRRGRFPHPDRPSSSRTRSKAS